MTVSEWNALEIGDIVIERRSRTPRLVVKVSRRPFKIGRRKGQPATTIELIKTRRSGFRYPCPTVILVPSDWRHRLDVAHGKRGRVRREFFWCECHGWSHISAERRAWVDPAYVAANPRTLARPSVGPCPRPDWSFLTSTG